jgi:hypothetical protein
VEAAAVALRWRRKWRKAMTADTACSSAQK